MVKLRYVSVGFRIRIILYELGDCKAFKTTQKYKKYIFKVIDTLIFFYSVKQPVLIATMPTCRKNG